MSMGNRSGKQRSLWVSFKDLEAPGHPFYQKLNELLYEAHFDEQVEMLCAPYYKDGGRPSIAPGVYFRMLFIGYFEGLDSQRGIAWRCADSLSLKEFLGVPIDERTPDHSTLTRIRKRLPLELHEDVFHLVLHIAVEKKLLVGKTIAVDSTYVEANAAMKSIVRRDTGEDYRKYVRRLAEEEGGLTDPSDEDVRRFDRKRAGKKTSNKEWKSPTDSDSRIVRMKDGRTHLGYKIEHAVDLDSDILVGAAVYAGDQADSTTLLETLEETESHMNLTGDRRRKRIEEVVADKGYHSTNNLAELRTRRKRAYIPEPERAHNRRWETGSEERRRAVYENRRRVRRAKGRALQRRRSELTERTFAHVCDTGGGRRSWIRGRSEIAKYHYGLCAARNLSVIIRSLIGVGKPKALQSTGKSPLSHLRALLATLHRRLRHLRSIGHVILSRKRLKNLAAACRWDGLTAAA